MEQNFNPGLALIGLSGTGLAVEQDYSIEECQIPSYIENCCLYLQRQDAMERKLRGCKLIVNVEE